MFNVSAHNLSFIHLQQSHHSHATRPMGVVGLMLASCPVRPNSGELSEAAGGTFGRLTFFNTANYQRLLDSNHSKAQNSKKERERKMMQTDVRNKTVRVRTYCIYAFRSFVCQQHSIKKVLRVTKPLNIPDEVKTPCNTSMAVPPPASQERLLGG